MKPNRYRKMAEQFHAEEPLKNETRQKIADARLRLSQPKKRRPRWQPVVACACALALAVGLSPLGGWIQDQTATFHPRGESQDEQNAFVITAYADDDTSAISEQQNQHEITFESLTEGTYGGGDGLFSGIAFRVQGSRIASLHLSMDRGGFYLNRQYELNIRDGGDPDAAVDKLVKELGLQPGQYSLSSPDLNNTYWLSTQQQIGNDVDVPYQEGDLYGFWMDAATSDAIPETDSLRKDFQNQIDLFDGATLTVTATFLDGTTQTQVLHLHTGKLKYQDVRENGVLQRTILLPELAEEGGPYYYGIYATLD